MGQIIIIEDLQPGKKADGQSDYQANTMREFIKAQQKLSAFIPRDKSVWTKDFLAKRAVKTAKAQHKILMLKAYPGYTNKSDFYTQKAMIWS